MSKLQRIRTGSTGALTPKERESLHELVKEYNSDFRVKTATVDDVSKITPEAGAIVVSKHDGKQYYADMFGWHQAGAEYSPVTLFIDFDGTTQFDFEFKLPSTSTITLNWGDGTSLDVVGQDDTLTSIISGYATAGVYCFTVTGDVIELTHIEINSQSFVSGDVSGWGSLINLTYIRCNTMPVAGDISGWSALTKLTYLRVNASSVHGDISGFSALILLDEFRFDDTLLYGNISGFSAISNLRLISGDSTSVSGDISGFDALTSLEYIKLSDTLVTGDIGSFVALTLMENLQLFDTKIKGDVSGFGAVMPSLIWLVLNDTYAEFSGVDDWPNMSNFVMANCRLNSNEVDNILISLEPTVTSATINIAGTNAKRTSASDAAYDALVAAGNTVTVNE